VPTNEKGAVVGLTVVCGVGFGLGFGFAVAAGVGVSTSEMGAGRRCAEISSATITRAQRVNDFTVTLNYSRCDQSGRILGIHSFKNERAICAQPNPRNDELSAPF
jgi:hypothetical protein